MDFLNAFVTNVGKALVSLTRLKLHLEDFDGSTCTADMLAAANAAAWNEVLGNLVHACPLLTQLCCTEGSLSAALWPLLGHHCPRLSTVELRTAGPLDTPSMQQMIELQPSLLPYVNKLILRGQGNYRLPDMSNNTSIFTLELPSFTFYENINITNSAWLCLPPKLRHLHCEDFSSGPPMTNAKGTPALASLLSLTIHEESFTHLENLGEILQAAPILQSCKCAGIDESLTIMCDLCTTSPADFLVYESRKDMAGLSTATFWFNSFGRDETSLLPFIASLPTLTSIIRAQIDYDMLLSVVPLLAALPCLQTLSLMMDQLDDIGLSVVVVCRDLLKLTVSSSHVSPMGVLSICLRLPKLCSFRNSCMKQADLEGVQQQMREHNRVLEFKQWWNRSD